MVINVARWHPPTCSCVVEVGVDSTVPQDKQEWQFVLMNRVCDKHEVLASTTHKENHQELAKIPLGHIEDAKRANMDQVNAMIEKSTRPWEKRDLLICRTQVQEINDRNTEEWNYLVAQTHAFDLHIYEQILKEMQEEIGKADTSNRLQSRH